MNCKLVGTRVVNSTNVLFVYGCPMAYGQKAEIGSVLVDFAGDSFYKKVGAGDKDWEKNNGPDTIPLITEAIMES